MAVVVPMAVLGVLVAQTAVSVARAVQMATVVGEEMVEKVEALVAEVAPVAGSEVGMADSAGWADPKQSNVGTVRTSYWRRMGSYHSTRWMSCCI